MSKNQVTTNVRVARVKDVLKFLYMTRQTFQEVLEALEEGEHYEECADILKDIKQMDQEIHEYEVYKLIEEQTGRQFKITDIPTPPNIRLPNDNKTK